MNVFRVLACMCCLPLFAQEITPLTMGKSHEHTLGQGERHTYSLDLNEGEYADVSALQNGQDIVLLLKDPKGKTFQEVDSPTGTSGTETLQWQADVSGTYQVTVKLFEGAGKGSYTLHLEERLSAADYQARQEAKRAKMNKIAKWLADAAVPLKTPVAGNGFEDMQGLDGVIGDARIVSMGESTHGTREIFQMKHRLLEYLVVKKNFNLFGIEATMPEAYDLNHYVLTGEGDPAQFLTGLYFWTWDTEEVLAMVRWMREYNADPAHTRKVKFYGFDMQFSPRAVHELRQYMTRIDPKGLPLVDALYSLEHPFTFRDKRSEKEWQDLIRAGERLASHMEKNRAAMIAASSEKEWQVARQHMRVVSQYMAMREAGRGGGMVRDRSMAENVSWILDHEGPDAKIALWAHNGHVARLPGRQGRFMDERHGHETVIIGFSFNQGGFQARGMNSGLEAFHLEPAPRDSLDWMLAKTGYKIAAFDLRKLPRGGPIGNWFKQPRGMWTVGAIFNPQLGSNYSMPGIVQDLYDVILFIESTTRARPNWQLPTPAKLEQPANGNFESLTSAGLPKDWHVPARQKNYGYQVSMNQSQPRSGSYCVEISRKPEDAYGNSTASVQQQLDVTNYKGKRIRVRFHVCSNVSGKGQGAFPWLRIRGQGFMSNDAYYNNNQGEPIVSKGWTPVVMEAVVPRSAHTITYGMTFYGNGQAWLDDVSVEVVDK